MSEALSLNDLNNEGILKSLNECAIIARTDKDGFLLEVNDKFCEVSGYSRNELIGKTHRILSSGKHEKRFFKDLWETVTNGRVWVGDIENKTKSGETFWVHTVITPVKNSKGEIIQFVTVKFDITIQKKKEHRVLEVTKFLEKTLETSGGATWEWDLDSNKFYASESFLNIFTDKTKGQDFYYENLLELIHPDERGEFEKQIASKREIFGSFNSDHRVLIQGQNDRWFNISCDFSTKKRAKCYLLDIASKKVAEQAKLTLISQSKMTSLGEMACGIIHEINNPLAIIVGRLVILGDLMSEDRPDIEELKKSFSAIDHSVKRICSITKGLSSFSRNSANDPKDEVLLSQVITDTQGFCRDNFSLKHVDLNVDIEAIHNVKILGRPSELSQVFLNLLSNAFDAVKNEPDPWVEVKASRSKTHVFIRVSDSGSRINPDLVDKLMQPFFTTKKVGKGTGLGLSISKELIELHNGTLLYDHTSEHTCFVVELPILNKGLKVL